MFKACPFLALFAIVVFCAIPALAQYDLSVTSTESSDVRLKRKSPSEVKNDPKRRGPFVVESDGS